MQVTGCPKLIQQNPNKFCPDKTQSILLSSKRKELCRGIFKGRSES